MNSLTLKSPAKLNLYLKVIRRLPPAGGEATRRGRSNGYHELSTLFHRISLADTLQLKKKSQGFSLTCNRKDLSTGEDNLITRAYRELQKINPKLGGVTVRLTKRIPMGGGLGGGSSNAAFFLLGMKRLYQLPLSLKQLSQMGLKLGADVPFFLHQIKQGLAGGIGGEIKSVSSKARHWFVLVIDPKGLSTQKVYQTLPRKLPVVSLTKVSRVSTILCDYLDRQEYDQAGRFLSNDLEAPAFQLRPSIKRTIHSFHKYGVSAARMSGSGPTVFAIVKNQKQAKALARVIRAKEPGKEVVICYSF